MQSIDLSFPPAPQRTCRVRVGTGTLRQLEDDLAQDPPAARLIVISDDNVAPLYGRPLSRRLQERGLTADLLTFPAGEPHKNRRTKEDLEDRLLTEGVGRDAAIVAVGGGVTGDLAGFVAATWQRGIPVVQVPTSLLAMADAAVGGKTGVNLAAAKNFVGSFHQPWGVYADISTLGTLPDSEFTEGTAEIVKSAAIADAELFSWLESSAGALIGRDATALEHAVTHCIRIKAAVVTRDEREAGYRAVLNFGHTVAHALEAVTDYALPHGRAVAIGMCVEGGLARDATGFPDGDLERLRGLLDACGLPTRLPAGLSIDSLVEAARRDKKARSGRARYALPERLGGMPEGDDVTLEIDEARLAEALAAAGGPQGTAN